MKICRVWGRHFATLYSDTESDSYDRVHFENVTACVNCIKEESILVHWDHIAQEEMLSALTTLNQSAEALMV